MARSVKGQLEKLLDGIEYVSPALFEELIEKLGTTSDQLRRRLRQTKIQMHPLIEGVRQDSLENLMQTLSKLAGLYPEQPESTRARVLESKRHTQFLLRRNPNDSWRKAVLLHQNTWLENPAIYPLWASLQKKTASAP